MKDLRIAFFIIFILIIPLEVSYAAYRLPFLDNKNIEYTQTWHSYGFYYTKIGANYSWVSGPDHAIDLQTPDSSNSQIVAPEDGTVKLKDTCSTSTNLIVESGGYEFQFYHLDKNNISVNANQNVTKGQILGRLYPNSFNFDGCGSSSGSHLHFRFQTKQGSSDPNRKIMSGYSFDEYDGTSTAGGASGCIMHRDEVNYCLYGHGGTTTFTANEPNNPLPPQPPPGNGCGGTNVVLLQKNVVGFYDCTAGNSITITPESSFIPGSDTIRFYIS